MADEIARANTAYNAEQLALKLDEIAQVIESWAGTLAALQPKLDEARAALTEVKSQVQQLVQERLQQMDEQARQERARHPEAPPATPPPAAPTGSGTPAHTASETPQRSSGPGARRSGREDE
jgi:ABC-type transporter Mla subunit MlaD